jgi:hypothetical protein
LPSNVGRGAEELTERDPKASQLEDQSLKGDVEIDLGEVLHPAGDVLDVEVKERE